MPGSNTMTEQPRLDVRPSSPSPSLSIEVRRAMWRRLWDEFLLRPVPNEPGDQAADGLSASAAAAQESAT